jgi:nucleotide-binding universal stress UspA family protein
MPQTNRERTEQAMIPPRRILATVDFSDASRVSLDFAARFARHCGAELHVLHAEDSGLADAAMRLGVDLVPEIREETARFVLSAAGVAEAAPRVHVVIGQAVDAICDIAWRERADLIVISARNRPRGLHRGIGPVTDGVIRHAAIPTCVVPDDWRPPCRAGSDLTGLGPVVAAVDDREPSLPAVAAAAHLARRLGVALEVVHVVPDIPVQPRWESLAHDAVARRRCAVEREIQAHLRGLRLPDLPPLTITVGDIAERLAASVAPGNGREPMLVMGRRVPGHRDNSPGSTASRVLALARVPVLIQLPAE